MSSHVLILGNPILREKSAQISNFNDSDSIADFMKLKNELEIFRRKNGYGRGISGIQIGIKKRIIALNFGEGPFVIINPEIIARSAELFTMWDDCMSFPDLMVRVKRNRSIGIKYQDENGCITEWENIEQDKSELLQHEIDHLDGIMAIDLAIENTDIIYKSEFNKNRGQYDQMVDYTITPTIK